MTKAKVPLKRNKSDRAERATPAAILPDVAVSVKEVEVEAADATPDLDPTPTTPTPLRRMSKSEIARRSGFSRTHVSRLLAQGFDGPQILQQKAERRRSRERAVEQQQQEQQREDQQRQQHGVPESSGESYLAAQRRKEIALANLREIEVLERRNELIPVGAANAFFGGLIVRAREVWMGISDLTDRVRQEPDVLKARQIVDVEIRRGLAELEKYGQMVAEKIGGGGKDD